MPISLTGYNSRKKQNLNGLSPRPGQYPLADIPGFCSYYRAKPRNLFPSRGPSRPHHWYRIVHGDSRLAGPGIALNTPAGDPFGLRFVRGQRAATAKS